MCLLSFQNLTKKKKDQSLTTVHSNKKCILETELDIRYLFFLSRFFMVSWTIFYFVKKSEKKPAVVAYFQEIFFCD